MSQLHIYFETGAIGDTGLNLCRANIAMQAMQLDSVIVHTSEIFKSHGRIKNSCKNVHKILESCNFIDKIEFDVDYNDNKSFYYSKKYECPITQPMIYREENQIKSWVDLQQYIPERKKTKTAILQPVSTEMKPQQFVDWYIPVWDRCVNLLHEKGYEIIMIGGENDPIEKTMQKSTINKTIDKIGKWSMLESLAFTIYEADIILACDSWTAIWGPAAKINTFTAWGYRMENNIDFWVTGFLGNQKYYQYGWSSQKEYCDAYLAGCISDFLAKGDKNVQI